VLLGNGDGTFQAPINTSTGGNLGLLAIADLNGDDYVDVLGGYGTVLYVFLGKGDGTLKPGVPYNLEASLSGTISITDVNGDGKQDVVYNVWVSTTLQQEVIVLLGNGDGKLQTPVTSAGLPDLPVETVVGDFNGDGKLDLVARVTCNCSTPYSVYFS